MRASVSWMIVVVLGVLSVGCASHPPAAAPVDANRPYLLHLPGIGGDNFMHKWFLDALVEGGFDAETALYDWTEGRFALGALQDIKTNKAEARTVARELTRRYRTDPQRPLYLTAESGGAGVALWALESLPPDVSVEAVVLLSPAVSPEYDLSPALAHVRSAMLVVSSSRDQVVLGAGTTLFGTMDRHHGPAAGMKGFHPPDRADPVAYEKVHQLTYDKSWLRAYGSWGGHINAVSARFARSFLAKVLTQIAEKAAAAQDGSDVIPEGPPIGLANPPIGSDEQTQDASDASRASWSRSVDGDAAVGLAGLGRS